MAFSMVPLLMHDDRLPREAREALHAASRASRKERRRAELELAARVLYRETDLECGEVRELVGLGPSANCG